MKAPKTIEEHAQQQEPLYQPTAQPIDLASLRPFNEPVADDELDRLFVDLVEAGVPATFGAEPR